MSEDAAGPQGYDALPRWRCHKEVRAAKITAVTHISSGAVLFCDMPYPDRILVGHDYVKKHVPQAGGYFVVYDDGYTSFSPGAAFEGGYTRI